MAARAEHFKPDDTVIIDLAAEDWVTTKTARVMVNVEASVSSSTAGTTRAAMTKALDDMIKTEWRLISFNRNQDSTGMEHWSAMYEARVPEGQLSGINEQAKKVSKPGMQLSVSNIDFSPTLDETQAALGLLRTKIYKMANEQLAALNATLTGRGYRIAMINFTQDGGMMGGGMGIADMAMTKVLRGPRAAAMTAEIAPSAPPSPPMERSEKLVMTARVIFAVTPPSAAMSTQAPAPVTGATR